MPVAGIEALGQQDLMGNDPSERLSDNFDGTEFMNLLLQQLKHQDPMDPMSNDQFISQMAELTSVEKLTAISQSIDNLARDQSTTQFLGLLGAYVEIDAAGQQEMVTGQVESVRFTEAGAQIIVDGKRIDSDDILGVSLADL